MEKFKLIAFIGSAIIFVALVSYDEIVEGPKIKEAADRNFLLYDTSEINGKISFVYRDIANNSRFAMAENPDRPYFATIHFIGKDAGLSFREIAQPGDSLIKHRHSDTLILIRKDRTYYCLAYP